MRYCIAARDTVVGSPGLFYGNLIDRYRIAICGADHIQTIILRRMLDKHDTSIRSLSAGYLGTCIR